MNDNTVEEEEPYVEEPYPFDIVGDFSDPCEVEKLLSGLIGTGFFLSAEFHIAAWKGDEARRYGISVSTKYNSKVPSGYSGGERLGGIDPNYLYGALFSGAEDVPRILAHLSSREHKDFSSELAEEILKLRLSHD